MLQLQHFNDIRTLFISLVTSVMATQAIAIEEPVYQVEKAWEAEQIEIRAYAPRVMAVTGMDEDTEGGFRVLAGYIFGGNAEEEKIAMTAPVIREGSQGDWRLSFVMPAEMTAAGVMLIRMGSEMGQNHVHFPDSARSRMS